MTEHTFLRVAGSVSRGVLPCKPRFTTRLHTKDWHRLCHIHTLNL